MRKAGKGKKAQCKERKRHEKNEYTDRRKARRKDTQTNNRAVHRTAREPRTPRDHIGKEQNTHCQCRSCGDLNNNHSYNNAWCWNANKEVAARSACAARTSRCRCEHMKCGAACTARPQVPPRTRTVTHVYRPDTTPTTTQTSVSSSAASAKHVAKRGKQAVRQPRQRSNAASTGPHHRQ